MSLRGEAVAIRVPRATEKRSFLGKRRNSGARKFSPQVETQLRSLVPTVWQSASPGDPLTF